MDAKSTCHRAMFFLLSLALLLQNISCKTLVLLENASIKETHSIFFNHLKESPDSSDDDDCQIIKTIQNRRSSISNEDDDCQVIEPIPNQRSSSSRGDGDCQVIETSTVKNERKCSEDMAYLNDDKRYPL
ncbi:uncharacterized protein [Clytia hemisphaerica]|uniref:uncharacterized protein n=1 Tax=Clytia hemisphaerica TaxID=252671 RepID=UPI0034D606FE